MSSLKYDFKNINQTLSESLQRTSHENKYIYLLPDLNVQHQVSYFDLETKAKAIAVLLQNNKVQKGDRVLLVYNPGIEFLYAFFGCLYAGAIAVPCYPPANKKLITKLSTINESAKPKIILSTTEIVKKINKLKTVKAFSNLPFFNYLLDHFKPGARDLSQCSFNNPNWFPSDEVNLSTADSYQDPNVTRDDIAFLQYTSGSTAIPKGVIVKHGNLLHNMHVLSQSIGVSIEDKVITWLPPFHDMGLIGSLLTPLLNQNPVYIISPLDFIKNPSIWLKAITQFQGTLSGAPNFAYFLCVNKINKETQNILDLSSWRVAFNGAEPINHYYLNEFIKTFARCGFNKNSLYPCYGLAESTLFVTGGYGLNSQKHPQISLEKEIVSCGKINPHINVSIIDDKTNALLSDGKIGEVCINGVSVTDGYWNNHEFTKEIFITLGNEKKERRFLKTGDLGFIKNNELFITGRIKELIIIRGTNYYPQDIEFSVYKLFKNISQRSCVAFSIEDKGEEHLAIVLEVSLHEKSGRDELFKNIRKNIMLEHQLIVHSIFLVKPKSIPKTTSGKLQRLKCKTLLFDNEFEIIAQSVNFH